MTSRRNFLVQASLAVAAASLARCSLVMEKQVNEPDNGGKTAVDNPATLQHAWTNVNGLNAHFLSPLNSTASNEVIVLVHGSGLSGRYMVPTAVNLSQNFQVYVPDLPGFGDTDKPEKIFDVPELADWLAAWTVAVGIDRATLLGNSFGCQVIADLAARHPERIKRAILQGPTTPSGERSWFWQFIRWRQNQPYNPKSLGPITYEDYRKCGAWRMVRSFRYQLTDRIEDKAPRIEAPVLVVRGEHDPIANQPWCEQIARFCPHGKIVVIPGVAHTLCYTAPVQLAAVSRSFVMQEAA